MCVAVSQLNYPLIIACKDTTKNPNMQTNLCFCRIFLLRAHEIHTLEMYCLTQRKLLQIFLNAFHADNILTFDPSGIVIDDCFVYCFSFYIEDSITSKKIRCRF